MKYSIRFLFVIVTVYSSVTMQVDAEPLRMGGVHHESGDVSIYRVVASPDKFEGERVRLRGYLANDGGRLWLFCNKAAFEVLDLASAILLTTYVGVGIDISKVKQEFCMKNVLVEGIVYVIEADNNRYNQAGVTKINHLLVLEKLE